MQARQFEQFLLRLSSLTRRQRDRLLALLQSAAGLDRALDLIDQPGQTPCCPRCRADRPYRHGHANGLQRYHSRMPAWLVPFCGIASRYLSQYFGSRWALDGQRISTADAFLRAAPGRFNT